MHFENTRTFFFLFALPLTLFVILKLSIAHISNQCTHLLNQQNAHYQIYINSRDTTLTCFSKNVLPEDGTFSPKHVGVMALLFICIQYCVLCWFNN